MAYVAITSDLNGHLFSIDHEGVLHHNWRRDEHTGRMMHHGLGQPIGAGWGRVRGIAATRNQGFLVVAAVGSDGTLMSAQVAETHVSAWHTATPEQSPAADSQLASARSIFGGVDGDFYAVTAEGRLIRSRFQIRPDAARVQPLAPLPFNDLGGDWGGGMNTFRCGNFIFDVTPQGELRCRSVRSEAMARFEASEWRNVGRGWTGYQRAFAADSSGIYTIGSEGALRITRFVAENDIPIILPDVLEWAIALGVIGWYGLSCGVEGYCVPQSVAAGGTVEFKIAGRRSDIPAKPPVTYNVKIVRLRRMQGGIEHNYDAKPIANLGPFTATAVGALPADWIAKGARWKTTTKCTVPGNAPGGLYAAHCTDGKGNVFSIPFVVRPRHRAKHAPFVLLANTNTWNAYNSWGGRGKYVHAYPLPRVLTFERPHPGLTPDVVPCNLDPKSEILNQTRHLVRAELWVQGWLEDLGKEYAYDLYSDRDLHDGRIKGLSAKDADKRYKGLILSTHPEYWTEQMYDTVLAYQRMGGNIIYLGGNGVYELVRLGGPRDPMTIFPNVDMDHVPSCATNEEVRTQSLMRILGRPERALFGVGFENGAGPTVEGQPFCLSLPRNYNTALMGLTLNVGDEMGTNSANAGHSASGWEVDRRGSFTPPEARTTDTNKPLIALGACESASGEMLYYKTAYGGVVFAAGSLNFGGSLAVDKNLQLIVTNVLDVCLGKRSP